MGALQAWSDHREQISVSLASCSVSEAISVSEPENTRPLVKLEVAPSQDHPHF